MEIQFLGTSSGTPTRSRNVSALALRARQGSPWVLVDCGEGTQHQILRTRLTLHSLQAIFITHLHGDHCYGLPGLLASAGMLNRTEPLPVVGPQPLEQYVRGVMEATQLSLPYPLEFVDVERLAQTEVLPDLAVQATALSHRLPSYAYSFTEKQVECRLDTDKLRQDGVPAGPLWGLIQKGLTTVDASGRSLRPEEYLLPTRAPRTVIVAGDNDSPALLREQACRADVLVHEATYTEEVRLKIGPAPQHSSAQQVARFAAEAGLRNLVLTHFSPRYQMEKGPLRITDIEAEARAEYDGTLFLARDLERYTLDRYGTLARAP